jgi:hypothetical protein
VTAVAPGTVRLTLPRHPFEGRPLQVLGSVQVELGGQVGADPGDAMQGDGGERPMPFGDQI